MSVVRPVARSRSERRAQALDDATDELRRGSVRLPARTRRAWMLGAGCVVLGGTALGMVLGPLSSLPFGSGERDTPFHVAMGLLGLVLFGTGSWLTIRYARQLRSGIVIDRQGVRVPGGSTVPWQQIVSVHRGRGRRGVTLIVRGRAHGPENRLGEAVFALRAGHSAVVLPRARRIDPDDVAALLAEGRRLCASEAARLSR